MNETTGFGMDTITQARSLTAKLAAMAEAGFSQVMLSVCDLASHFGGVAAVIVVVQASGLRTTGFQVLPNFEGLAGYWHDYKMAIARTFAAKTLLDGIDELDPERIFRVQLSDFLWHETPSFEERMVTARTFRVCSGEGVHSDELADLVLRLDKVGYRGDDSYEVFNDDYQQLPLNVVAQRAWRGTLWLSEDVLYCAPSLPSG
jgi:hypothetical protein